MLQTYNEVLPETLANFGRMRLDAAVVACSASHYLLSVDGDQRFCAQLTKRFGFPVLSSTQAILETCRALGVKNLTLVSPYEPWLADTSRDFWQAAGLAVDQVIPVPTADGLGHPYEITTEQILAALAAHRPAPGVNLLFTGTGMATLETLTQLARDTDWTLLTSNLASAWWALRVSRQRSTSHPLLRRISAA